MNIAAVLMVSATSVGILALAAAPQASPPPAPAKASAAPASSSTLSKYQRERLEKFKNSAPADEYFGRMKMSFLGINNTFRDASIASGDHTLEPAIVNKVALADDALQDWARKFPRDPQLPRSYFLAIASQKKIWLKPNQDRAWIYMNRIVQVFPATFFAKTVKKDMELGFTEHYYAEATFCATPAPTATPEPQPSAAPSEAPRRGARATPTPTASPTPTVAPTPTPMPSASPRVVAKGLKVQIDTPPCVPPPSPSPTPLPLPSPNLVPATVPSASPQSAASGKPRAVR